MNEQRVTPEQARTFAAYVEEDEATLWYEADPSMENATEADVEAGRCTRDEMLWLRDLARDLLDVRAVLREAVDDLTSWRDDFAPDEGNECLTDPTQEWLQRTGRIIERGNALLGVAKEGG